MKRLLYLAGLLIVIAVTSLVTLTIDNLQFQKEIAQFVNLEKERDEWRARCQKYNSICFMLKAECDRQARVAQMVKKPSRTEMKQRKDKKFKMITIPPDPNMFDMFENYIELKPEPHLAQKQIDKARWDQIWKCNCPLSCDCWIGKPCSTKNCMANHP